MRKLIKKIYSIIPLKKQLFLLLRLIWKPKQSIYKHLHFKGVIKVPVYKSSFKIMHYGYFLENEIFWAGLFGSWEKESLKIWVELSKNAKVIVDIGANTGIYSLVAKTVNKDAKVFAFEPVDRIYRKLDDNIKLNNYEIQIFDFAVSNKDGEAIIYDSMTEVNYTVSVNKNLFTSGTNVVETKIKTIKLDTFINENSIDQIDLIKIDVETHEPEVLEGFSNYMSKFKPSILIEITDQKVADAVFELVKNMDYLYYNIDEKGAVKQIERPMISNTYNNLFCSKEKAKLLGLSVIGF